MPRYNSGNFSFVIDSHFQPFSMQEMLVPFMAYKDAYERSEEAYQNLSEKADVFKDLASSLPEESKARQIYEGYANELGKQADDLARNGLSMRNRRALQSLKRRYQGEIGLLDKANTALQKELDLRRQISAKDPSMLYAHATQDLNIDNFLYNQNPNLYNISGDVLYAKGAAAGKAASSRIYNSGDGGRTLGNYYRDWVERRGYSPESMNAFRQNIAAIPELQQAVDDILVANGAFDNLTGKSLEAARRQVINGIIDGAIYDESHKPVRDEGVMSAAQQASHNLSVTQMRLGAAAKGMVQDEHGNWIYDRSRDPDEMKNEWMYNHDPITGERSGYSEAYLRGQQSKKNSTSTRSSSTSAKVNLRKPISYNKDGNVTVLTGQKEMKGRPITFEEAYEINPAIGDYHPGYEHYYDYLYDEKNENIIIIPNPTYGQDEPTYTGFETPEDEGHNAI